MRQFIALTSAYNGHPLLVRPYTITAMLPTTTADPGAVEPGSYVLLGDRGTDDGIAVVETPEQVEALIDQHAEAQRAEDDARVERAG